VRERGNCLLRAAQGLQNAAHNAAALEQARAAVALCEAPPNAPAPEAKPTTTTTIENIAVEWPRCAAGDPLCNDTTTFDAAPIVRSVRRHRGGFASCGDQASKPGHVRILLRLGEIDDRARPVSVQVEEDSLKEPRVTQCLTRSAARLTFPSNAAAARVRLTVKTPGR